MTGGAFLSRMAESSRARAAAAAAANPEPALVEHARAAADPVPLRLADFDVIAELKLRSPAAGGLARAALEPADQLAAYAQGGAAAVSVLTEPDEFGGTLEHLRAAAAALAPRGLPVMRKDFLTTPYQVVEARAAGASGVLVIVTMLDDTEAQTLVDRARDFGMFVLLEAFDAQDLARIARIDVGGADPPVLAGLNCRDLRTLAVDFDRFEQLAGALPAHLPVVAESGVETPADVAAVAALGYRLCLVGSALMRAPEPGTLLAGLVGAGRAAARER